MLYIYISILSLCDMKQVLQKCNKFLLIQQQRMHKAREEGWRNLMSPMGGEEVGFFIGVLFLAISKKCTI